MIVEDLHFNAAQRTLEVEIRGHLTECAARAIQIGHAVLGDQAWSVVRFNYVGSFFGDSKSLAKITMQVKGGS
jgi:hypothetical protein